uniref:Uncharacterized protein n=1 Tax=Anguilla anguilla TaxID=7936 RepID=A0A0E9XX12_ANGAN
MGQIYVSFYVLYQIFSYALK